MAIVAPIGDSNALMLRGRLGRGNGCGDHWLGWSDCGDDVPEAGIYQRRPRPGGQICVRMRFYRSSGGNTERQLERRAVFTQGVAAWRGMSEIERITWRAQRAGGVSGFNVFMRQFLRSAA